MKNKKLLFTGLALTTGLMGSSFSLASEFADVNGHWAEGAIDRWSSYNVVSGYGDGEFGPNNNMTRAELAQVICNTLQLKATRVSSFKDVPATSWYAEAVAACAEAGIINGKGNNSFAPNDTVTREETIVMLGRALSMKENKSSDLDKFNDNANVSDWAEGYIAEMVSKNIISGVGNGMLAPKSDVTRSQVLTILNNAISNYIVEDGKYDISEKSTGITLVLADNVKLTGTINGDILADQGKDSVLEIEGAKVTGEVNVKSEDTVVKVSDGAEASKVNVLADNVEIVVDKDSSVGNIQVAAKDTYINVSGKVEQVDVTGEATNTEISGKGEVEKVDVQDGANKTNVSTVGTEVVAEEGASNTVAGDKKVSAGDTVVTEEEKKSSSSGSSSSGSSSSSTVKVTIKSENEHIETNGTTMEYKGYTNNDSIEFTATVTNTSNKELTWKLDDSDVLENSIVKVEKTETGVKVTPKTTGTVTLTATTTSGKSATVTLKILPEIKEESLKLDVKSKIEEFKKEYYNKKEGTDTKKVEPISSTTNWYFPIKMVLPLGSSDQSISGIDGLTKDVEVSIGNNNFVSAKLAEISSDYSTINLSIPAVLFGDLSNLKIGETNIGSKLQVTKSDATVNSIDKESQEISIESDSSNWKVTFNKEFTQNAWEHGIKMQITGANKSTLFFVKIENTGDGTTYYAISDAKEDGSLKVYPPLENRQSVINYEIAACTESSIGVAKTTVTYGPNGNTTYVDNIKISYNGREITDGKIECNDYKSDKPTITLTAEVNADATNKSLKWEINDGKNVATVDGGTVTLLKTGKTTITVTAEDNGKFKKEITLTVVPVFKATTISDVTTKLKALNETYYDKSDKANSNLDDGANWYFDVESELPIGEEDQKSVKLNGQEIDASTNNKVSIGSNNFITGKLYKFDNDKLKLSMPLVLFEDMTKLTVGGVSVPVTFKNNGTMNVESAERGMQEANGKMEVSYESNVITVNIKEHIEPWIHGVLIKFSEENLTDTAYFTKTVNGDEVKYGITSAEEGGKLGIYVPLNEEKESTLNLTVFATVDSGVKKAETTIKVSKNPAEAG